MLILLWLALACAIGTWARSRGNSFVGYSFLSLLFSPIVGATILMLSDRNMKDCPKCAEEIKTAATVCKHCGHEFSQTMNSKDKAS